LEMWGTMSSAILTRFLARSVGRPEESYVEGLPRYLGVRGSINGKVLIVDHIVVDSRGRIAHYGLHSVRGWNLQHLTRFRSGMRVVGTLNGRR
jgi:hypothetical protein